MATQTKTPQMKQLVDWGAALWAGIIAGLIFLISNIIIFGLNPWFILRYLAYPILGEQVLPPTVWMPSSASADLTVLAVGLTLHFTLSILFAMLIAFILHRWGLLIGVMGGALLGLALYCINFYTLTFFFPKFWELHGLNMMITHILFGALAGGIYELREVEKFVPVEE